MPCISTSSTVMERAQALVDAVLLAAVKHHPVEARSDTVDHCHLINKSQGRLRNQLKASDGPLSFES